METALSYPLPGQTPGYEVLGDRRPVWEGSAGGAVVTLAGGLASIRVSPPSGGKTSMEKPSDHEGRQLAPFPVHPCPSCHVPRPLALGPGPPETRLAVLGQARPDPETGTVPGREAPRLAATLPLLQG